MAVRIDGDSEKFASPEDLMDKVTPEAAARFQRLEIRSAGDTLAVDVDFIREPADQARVEMRVASNADDAQDRVVEAARDVALAVRRGFRRHMARSEWSPNLDAAVVGRRSRGSARVVSVLPMVIGAAMGWLLVQAVSIMFPKADPEQWQYLLMMGGVGIAYSLAYHHLVPPVEIAEAGRSRLRKFTKWICVTLAVLIFTQVVKVTLNLR